MKLKKLLIASAVVAAVAGAMSTAAFAEEYDLGLQWNAETKTVTVTKNPTFEGDKTMVVIPCNEDGGLKTEINEEDIKQIDQKADGYTDIKFTDLAPGKYEVRIGGDGHLYSAIFEVKGEAGDSPYYDDGTVLLGNANLQGGIDGSDALLVMDYATGKRDGWTKDQLQAMDVNESTDGVDANIDSEDALVILDYSVGDRSVLGEKTIAEREIFVPVE